MRMPSTTTPSRSSSLLDSVSSILPGDSWVRRYMTPTCRNTTGWSHVVIPISRAKKGVPADGLHEFTQTNGNEQSGRPLLLSASGA